jgi:hypothetical protein
MVTVLALGAIRGAMNRQPDLRCIVDGNQQVRFDDVRGGDGSSTLDRTNARAQGQDEVVTA